MKKYLLIISALLLSLSFTSCEKDEYENTAIVKMAGEWEVVVDAVDKDGKVLYEDPYEAETVTLSTYNLVDNSTQYMWLDDNGSFWSYKLIVNINYDKLTFWCDEKDYDADGTGTAIITDGEIVENGALNENGKPTDSISFYVVFSDDEYAGTAWDKLWVHGRRVSGFNNYNPLEY